jgi:LETM1 and EF-hand domain-containing protein 1
VEARYFNAAIFYQLGRSNRIALLSKSAHVRIASGSSSDVKRAKEDSYIPPDTLKGRISASTPFVDNVSVSAKNVDVDVNNASANVPTSSSSTTTTTSTTTMNRDKGNSVGSNAAATDGVSSKEKSKVKAAASESSVVSDVKKKLTVWEKVKHEAQHYWDGTKLLGKEIKISFNLALKMAAGHELSRRENRQV